MHHSFTIWISVRIWLTNNRFSHNEECFTLRIALLCSYFGKCTPSAYHNWFWCGMTWLTLSCTERKYLHWMEGKCRNIIPLVDTHTAHLVGLCYVTFVFNVVFPPPLVIGPAQRWEFNLWVRCNDLATYPAADFSLCPILFLSGLRQNTKCCGLYNL